MGRRQDINAASTQAETSGLSAQDRYYAGSLGGGATWGREIEKGVETGLVIVISCDLYIKTVWWRT